jgi:cysteine synthase
MPDTMTVERRKVMAAFGAQFRLTPGAEGMKGALQAAEAIVASNPALYFMPQQFRNPVNPLAHELTTGIRVLPFSSVLLFPAFSCEFFSLQDQNFGIKRED